MSAYYDQEGADGFSNTLLARRTPTSAFNINSKGRCLWAAALPLLVVLATVWSQSAGATQVYVLGRTAGSISTTATPAHYGGSSVVHTHPQPGEPAFLKQLHPFWTRREAPGSIGAGGTQPSRLAFIGDFAALPALLAATAFLWHRRLRRRASFATFTGTALVFDDSEIPIDTDKMDKGLSPADTGMDADMERSRPLHRTVYDNQAWRDHRDGTRIFRAALGILRSRIMGRLSFEVSMIAFLATLICVIQSSPWGLSWLSLPLSIFSLTAPSLGLLLVFRTNASYGRWDETRRLFGQACNRCRELARKAMTKLPDEAPQRLRGPFLRYLQAFPFVLKVYLRGGHGGSENDDNLVEDLQGTLEPDELELLLAAGNRPLHVFQCLTEIIQRAKLDTATAIAMEHSVSALADMYTALDRLLRTPIPLSYTSLTTRFLVLWLVLLPLALSADVVKGGHAIWLTIPAVSFIAFLLFGIEEVGVQIEESFTILPLEVIAQSCRRNIEAIEREHPKLAALVDRKARAARDPVGEDPVLLHSFA
eukprot:EG_transcript_7612